MKRFLPSLLLCVLFFFQINTSFGQKNSKSVLLSEDFDGLSVLPSGWAAYTAGWDMVFAATDQIHFFKQSSTADQLILLAPTLDLTNATQLTFDFKSVNAVTTLKVGTMSNPTNPSSFVLLTSFQADTAFHTYTVPLGTLTGSNHLAFSWNGVFFYTALLDNVLVVDDPIVFGAPAGVSNLRITPSPTGNLTAAVSWTNPSLDADGNPLTDLDSIVLQINGQHYKTFNLVQIGSPFTTTVNVPVPGFYAATVIPYNSSGAGATQTTAPVWVGLDVPAAPRNLTLTSIEHTATLTWSKPDSGASGQYYNGIVDFYNVIRADGKPMVVPGTDTTVTFMNDEPGTFNFKVIPYNPSGEGISATSNARAFLIDDYLLWEDYWVSVPALDWTKQGYDEYSWWQFPWDDAGGEVPEMVFQRDDGPSVGESRMVSPVLNTSGLGAVTLEFSQMHLAVAGGYNFMVKTSSDGGVNWQTVWTIPVKEEIAAQNVSLVIHNSDVGSASFQFALAISGGQFQNEYIALDNIRLKPVAGIDMAAKEIQLPVVVHPADVLVPKAVIQSLSATDMDYSVHMTISDETGIIYSSMVNTTIVSGSFDTVTFENWNVVEGAYRTRVVVSCAGDVNQVNDTIFQNFTAYYTSPRSMVILEKGTGTWCTYCPGAAMGYEDLLKNEKPVALISYHSGDVFETPEGTQMLNYYGVTGYPTVIFDGLKPSVGGNHSQSLYGTYLPFVEERMSIESPIQVSLSDYTYTDKLLSAKVNIASLSPIKNKNLVLRAVLTESHIQYEWQDQTEINAMERLMFGGAAGSAIDLADKNDNLTISYTIDPSWVLGELKLVVFVQDTVTKEIFNGDMQVPLSIHEYNNEKLGIFPNPARDAVYITNPASASQGSLLATVSDLMGRIMITSQDINQNSKIDVSRLNNGFYLIKLTDGERTWFAKLEIAR